MRFPNLFRQSLRIRLLLGTGVMILPLLFLGAGGVYSFRAVMDSMDRLVQAHDQQLDPLSELIILLYRANMPPHDYLVHGVKEERAEYRRLVAETDRKFDLVLHMEGLDKASMPIMDARSSWELAKETGAEILAAPDPRRDPGLPAVMERYNVYIDQTAAFLDQAHRVIHREIVYYNTRSNDVERKATVFMLAVFLIGLVTAAVSALVLARSIILPLRALEDGIARFQTGDHSHRVTLNRRDELGSLADTLNVMAERLEFDSLTGVYNRREFFRRLDNEVNRAQRYGHVFSVLMMDLDHFKAVNDTHGHLAGDEALRAAAKTASLELRGADIMARYGGEEFALLLPETVAGQAFAVAERIRSRIASRPVPVRDEKGEREIRLTVSIGIAAFPVDGKTSDELIRAADDALYQAKQGGRNRVVRFAYQAPISPDP